MPLPFPSTIDRQKVMANVAYLIDMDGQDRGHAIARSFNEARKSWFKKFPEGALPAWLAYKAGMRNRIHYNADGAPLKGNPLHSPVRRAARLYKGFTGDAPDSYIGVPFNGAGFKVGLLIGSVLGFELDADGAEYVIEFDGSDLPALAVPASGHGAVFIGGDWKPLQSLDVDNCRISAIMYRTKRDNRVENYRHAFKPSAQPALTVIDARNAKASGGSFRFTDRGFVDSPRRQA